MRTHSVYIIQARTMKLVKIGCAGNVPERMANLQIGSPDELVLLWRSRSMTQAEAFGTEAYLHKKFENSLVRGEWYDPEPEILSFIEDMALTVQLKNAPADIRFLEMLTEPAPTIKEMPLPVPTRKLFRRKNHDKNRLKQPKPKNYISRLDDEFQPKPREQKFHPVPGYTKKRKRG